jgi:Reverse transcriptase (RNA-dependent DNA polymerase)
MEVEITQNGSEIPGEIFCLQSLFPDPNSSSDEEQNPLTAYKATADPDTMYMHEAMRAPDRQKFIQAMEKEVGDQMANGNYTIVRRKDVPKGHTIFRAVWQMKRKRDIKTREVKKWKARLNLDGSSMKKGKHYDQTYAPVARWNSIRLLLSMAALHGWHTTQIDYVSAFPQAPVERELYMQLPRGFEIADAKPGEYILRLNKNVYGQKSAGRVWNQYLTNKLTKEVGFTQSKTDDCVFFKGNVVYLLYTDDSILAGPSKKEIDMVIQQIKDAKLNITVEGDIQDFLGVNIERKSDGTVHLTQPHLIDSILEDLRMVDDKVKTKSTPASSSKTLSRFPKSAPFDRSFHYRRIIGKLNYLEKGSRSDIAYIVHQCARFVQEPKEEHGQALRWLGRYLKGTRDKGKSITQTRTED